MNIQSHNHWINQIRNYVGNYSDEEIIKLSLSYTLQSLRENENNLTKYKWKENQC